MSTYTLNQTPEPTLDENANTVAMGVIYCNSLAQQVDNALDRAWQTGVVLGYELTKLKASLPHGEFGKLFKITKSDTCVVFSFTQRQAQRYITLYAKCAKAAAAKQLGNNLELQLANREEDTAALVDTFDAIAPEAKSMRQALLALDPPAVKPSQFASDAPAPTIAAPNTKGQIRKSAEEQLEAAKANATAAVDLIAERLQTMLEDGSLLHASDAALIHLQSVCKVIATQISNTHIN